MPNPLQQTYEWFEARCGCLTASRAKDAIARNLKGGKYAAYDILIDKVLTERVTGVIESTPTNAAMQWGIDHEDDARSRYMVESGNDVDLAGFILHPTIEFFGASPDGLIGTDGLVEIKCPTTAVHLRRVKEGVVPEEYKAQMQVQLLCTGRKYVDFVDFDPRLTREWEKLQYFCVRYEPTAEELKIAEERCVEFLNIVADEYKKFYDLLGE